MTRFFLKLSVLLFFLISSEIIHAQFSLKSLEYGVSFNESLSHTGVNSGITANVRYLDLEVYGGPEMALSDSYFSDDPRWGFTLGFRYFSTCGKSSSSYLFVNYQSIYYRPYLEDFYPSSEFNTSTEIIAGLGQEWYLFPRVYAGISMGYGRYFDKYHDLPEDKTVHFEDFSILMRFSVTYKFE